MAAGASIGGLASGLDTATIISQLMQVEALPQTKLKSKLSTEQSTIGSLQALNAKFAALATKASDLAKPPAWSPATASSSYDKVSVAAGSAAQPGTLSFTVGRTAAAHQLSFTTTAALTDTVTGGGNTLKLDRLDGTAVVDIAVGDGSLSAVITGINSSSTGLSASALKLDDGTYRLRVVCTTTGEESDFTLTNADGSALLGGATVTAGRDAAITVGTDTIRSATNTFTGLMQGVDVTLGTGAVAGTAVDLTMARDSGKASDALKGLVEAANEILTEIDKLTAYNATTKKAGVLAGDATLRELRSDVLDTVTRAADGGSMSNLGVQTDRYGKVVFDATKFASAYAADPGAVGTQLGAAALSPTPGFAARVQAVAKAASDSTEGTLTDTITSRQSSVTTMQKSIDSWDDRLELRRATLTRQFTTLEVTLSKLQSQSSWLAGQLGSLPTTSSGSQ